MDYDQNNDRLVGVLRSKNKMLSYNVHKFTISITIIRSQSVHSTHIHDVYIIMIMLYYHLAELRLYSISITKGQLCLKVIIVSHKN